MVINGDWKIKVRMMRENGDKEGAKRELRKAKMSKEYRKTSDSNKIFIDYCLAHFAYKEKEIDLANYYLKYIDRIFKNDSQNILDMNIEYCNYLWLKVDVNHENMLIKDIVTDMTEVYKYYIKIDEQDRAIGALINIFCFEGKKDEIIESLDQLLKCNKISDWNFVNSILETCDSISHELYIRALQVIDKNKININIV